MTTHDCDAGLSIGHTQALLEMMQVAVMEGVILSDQTNCAHEIILFREQSFVILFLNNNLFIITAL